MKKRNMLRKVLSLALAALMCVSIPMTVLAETVTETETISENGLTTVTTTTTDTTANEDGTVLVEITIHEKTTTDDASASTQYTEEILTVTTELKNGDEVLESQFVEEGSQITEKIEEDKGREPGQPEITVPLKPDETTTGAAETVISTQGDVKSGEGDLQYDYTEESIVERSAEATMSEGEITAEANGESTLKPIETDHSLVSDPDQQLLERYSYVTAIKPAAKTEAPEGYDFRYTEFGQMSDFYVGTVDAETGKQGYSGALQFELIYDPDYVPGTNAEYDEKLDVFTAYCVDLTTGAKGNYWYRIDNLEDAGYYDEEAAEHIRSVVTAGYWGTVTDDEEDPAVGSLEKLKADMKAKINAGYDIGLTLEEVDAITAGQALNATQAAIWSYANNTTEGDRVDENRLAIKGNGGDVPDEQTVKNVNAIYAYLRGLEPTEKSEENIVIDQDSFLKEDSMSITIGDMTDAEVNYDDDEDNNEYNVAINFALVVTPSDDNDDLIVQVISGIDADGTPIIAAQGRIAGGNAEEDSANGFHNVVFDAETGVYSLQGLELAENSDFSFDLKLVGTQHLEEGVYIFTSEIRNGTPSQTMVGIAGGEKEVNVKQSFVINFNVDENNKTVVKHNWRIDPQAESDEPDGYTPDPTTEPTYPVMLLNDDGEIIEEEPVPLAEGPAADEEELTEIPDEEVPLADVPETGDISLVWAAMSIFSAGGVVILNKKPSKKER